MSRPVEVKPLTEEQRAASKVLIAQARRVLRRRCAAMVVDALLEAGPRVQIVSENMLRAARWHFERGTAVLDEMTAKIDRGEMMQHHQLPDLLPGTPPAHPRR